MRCHAGKNKYGVRCVHAQAISDNRFEINCWTVTKNQVRRHESLSDEREQRGSVGSTVANAALYDYVLALEGPNGLSIGRTHMPKFLRIGVHQSNVSGYTSKAWCIRRVGSTVLLKWGAVGGVGDGRKIYWTLPPRTKTIRCGTVQRAKDYSKAAIARRRNHRYEPLAGNIAIRRRPANGGAELKRALATILFVDIVRSTEKAARLGDSRWTQVMNHYYAAVRKELKTLRGKEVVTTG